MKKRLLSVLLCLMMSISVFAPMLSAADEVLTVDVSDITSDEKRFTDVTEGSWYAEGVEYCVDAGYMSGTSETSFSPRAGMNRAMFVTMLASYDGADLTKYTGSSFTDVAEGKWYSAAIEWAYKNGIVSGIGDGVFGYKNTVTRQEIAAMLMTYVKYKGGDVTPVETFKYTRYADLGDVSGWASDAVKWACGIGLFDAAGNEGDAPVICPKNTATRAQVALIMMNFDQMGGQELPTLTIAGNDISLYSIVIPETPEEPQEDAADMLQKYISEAYGIELPIVSDAADPSEYEIVLGKTTREEAGLITVDRSDEYELNFTVTVQDSRLVIAGVVDAENRRGTLYGAYEFAEDALGYTFYSNDIIIFDGTDHAVDADYTLEGGPGFEYRCVYWKNGWNEVYNNHEDYYIGCNGVHELAQWIDSKADARAACPCLTDEENIQKVIDTVLKKAKKKAEASCIWVSQPDSREYCTCDTCTALYNENGGNPSASIIYLCNRVCEALDAEGLSDFKVLTLAYQYSAAPPTNMEVDDDIIVYYCTIENCISCPYYDSSCPLNRTIAADLELWGKLCDKLYIWDYSTNFRHELCPFPDFYNLRENVNWFYENGVRGVFNNAISETSGEFGELRAFLLSKLYYTPDMTEEEYFALIDGYLEAYYGDGWKNVREYIDLLEEWSTGYHFECKFDPDYGFNMIYFAANADKLNAMWDEVEAKAESQWQLDNIRRSRLSCTYMILNARYYIDYQLGSDDTRSKWLADNEEFYNEVMLYNVRWTEETANPQFIADRPPVEW